MNRRERVLRKALRGIGRSTQRRRRRILEQLALAAPGPSYFPSDQHLTSADLGRALNAILDSHERALNEEPPLFLTPDDFRVVKGPQGPEVVERRRVTGPWGAP